MSHRSHHRRHVGLLLCVFALAALACGRQGNEAIALDYRVEVSEDAFLVTLTVTGSPGRRPELRLLDGWGLLQDMGSHVTGLTVTDGAGRTLRTERRREEGEIFWRVVSRPRKGKMVVRYRVTPYDPSISPEASFIDGDRFLALGYSLFLLPAQLRHNETVRARVSLDPGEFRPVWTSWNAGGAESPSTPHDIWSGVLAGGAFSEARLGRPPVTVTVLTGAGITGATGLTIANRLLPVLKEMERYFGSPPRGEELHVLAVYRSLPEYGRQSLLYGTSEENAFLCLATPDRFHQIETLTVLAVHECLHFYLGGAISADPVPPFRNAPEMVWLMEGMTEYLTYRLMAQAGAISPGRLSEVEAEKYAKYRRTSEGQDLTLADAARRMDDLAVYELVYSRGYLAGKLTAESLERCQAENGLRGFLRQLFARHNFYLGQPPVDMDTVERLLAERCPETWEVVKLFALGNEKLPVPRGEPAAE